MRPLHHPAADDVTVEGILHALADPVRVAIFSQIVASDCSQTCSAFLTVSDKAIPKSTLSQHFKALREAGLIRAERRGVELYNVPRCAELNERFPGLVGAILDAHKTQVETKKKAKPEAPVPPKRKSPAVSARAAR